MRTSGSAALRAEKSRLRSLRSYRILDTIPESEYDNITKIAAGICQVPVSLMTLMDHDRQWFKSRHGFEITELPRQLAFCNSLMTDPANLLVVPDLRADERFAHNPLVAGEPNVVFYAGAALCDPLGRMVGSICVYDQKARTLDEHQQSALAALALQVMNSLELRKKLLDLKKVQQRLRKVNHNLQRFARVVSHDIKTPLASISMLTTAVEDSTDNALHAGNRALLDLIHRNARHLQEFVDGVLEESGNVRPTHTAAADPNKVIQQVTRLIGAGPDVHIAVDGLLPRLAISETALLQVLQNLITNAIKYNDRENVEIRINAKSSNGYNHLTVVDNGRGIPAEKLQSIFEEHKTLDQTDRFGKKGTGIGLATVKRLLSEVGGEVTVDSSPLKGTVFTISLPLRDRRKRSVA